MQEHKFTVDDNEYKIVKPNNKVRKESDAVYAKAYRKAIADGLFLEAEIDNIIKERGLKAANETERKKLEAEISSLESMFNRDLFSSLEEGMDSFNRIADLRKDLDDLEKARRELSTQSATIFAENERFSFFVFSCSYDSEGERIWDKLEEYKEDVSELASRFASEMIQIVYGGAQEILNELEKIRPENIWLDSKRGSFNSEVENEKNDPRPEKQKKNKKKED